MNTANELIEEMRIDMESAELEIESIMGSLRNKYKGVCFNLLQDEPTTFGDGGITYNIEAKIA